MKRIGVVGVPGSFSTERLADAVEALTGFRLVVDLSRTRLDLESGRVYFQDHDLGELDAIVIKKVASDHRPEHLDRLELLRIVASSGVPVISDPDRILRVLNRLTCTVTLRLHDIPMPPTVITEDVEEAAAAVGGFGKAVLKPLFSSKARGMILIEPGSDLVPRIRAFKENRHPVIYVQKFMELPGQDLALVFLGGEFLGCYARVRKPGSWDTTTRSGGVYKCFSPGDDLIELARRAQAPFGLDFASVDIAECPEGPRVFEVSAFGGFRGLLKGCDVDAAERYSAYVLKRISDGSS